MNIASCLIDVPHPGEFIREELEAREWSQRDLAYILGVSEQSINVIISGKRGISPEMAKALSKAFGISAEYFANLQKAYEMSKAREPDPSVAQRAAFQSVFPIREMIRRGWLIDSDTDLLQTQLMRFFCKNALSEIPYMAHAAKKKDYCEPNDSDITRMQLAWLYRVRQLAFEMVVPKYSEKKLRTLANQLPKFMTDPEEVRHVSGSLAECGVRYVVVETLPKADIDGVCFWLDRKSPVIGMTTRYDRIDNFWFVLRHEIEHVLQTDGTGSLDAEKVDVGLEGDRAGFGESLPPEERQANLAAADLCVPSQELESFFVRKYPYISERDTLGFARRVQRHPGIVVGQLQRRMGRYDWLTRHKVRIRHFLTGNTVMDGWGEPAPVSL